MTSDAITSDRASRAGQCIDGRYQLEAEIGAGGLGSVYRALQTKLARRVAVKLLHESMFASDVTRARFEREARALAALEHPNIVSILDYGVADGQPYIVTELLEGETLAQRLQAGSLPLGAVMRFADELLDALAFMHEAGVVHRDLKASNVFLQRVHGGERVKLLDFGLAKTTVLGPGAQGDATLTRDGTVVGTPAYMSPEQATGDVVDARSDVYSVGVLLYQMLTGRLPFEGDAIDQVRSHLVEPVPALALRSASRELAAALEELIKRAMAKRREDRFANARQMVQALSVIREHGAATLPPAAAKTRVPPRRVLPPLGVTLRFLRVFCVALVVVQLFVIVLLVRDAEGRAALVHVGRRSEVALSSFGARSMYWGSQLAAWVRALPASQAEGSASRAMQPPSAASGPGVASAPRAAAAGAAAASGPQATYAIAGSAEARVVERARDLSGPQAMYAIADRAGRAPRQAGALATAPGIAAAAQLSAAAGARAPAPDTTASAPASAQSIGAGAGFMAEGAPGSTQSVGAGADLMAAGPRAAGADEALAPGALAPELQTGSGAQPSAATAPPSAATTSAAAPAASIAAVPGPPKPRNPWTRGTPPELRGIRRSVLAGGIGDDRVASILRTYSQNHPGDPRGQLLLGMMYLNRNWRSDAVAQFANAIKTDLSARGAPELLDSLLEVVASGRADADAASLIKRAYGSEALAALDAKIAATRAPEAITRLRALRARLDRTR